MMKKNKIIGLIIIIGLIFSLSGFSYYSANIAEPIKAEVNEFNETFSTNPAITQNDVNNNYQNYASDEGTYYFGSSTRLQSLQTINHVGTVMDIETDDTIPGAIIKFNETKSIVTDQNGRFQIPDLPAGEYDCIIHAEGYKDSFYLNMEMKNVGSTIVSIFYVSKKNEYVEDHDMISQENPGNINEELTLNSAEHLA